jgi:hypothetical protein
LPEKDSVSRRSQAILILSAAIGGINLARVVNDEELSQEILATVRQQLLSFTQKVIRHRRSTSNLSE